MNALHQGFPPTTYVSAESVTAVLPPVVAEAGPQPAMLEAHPDNTGIATRMGEHETKVENQDAVRVHFTGDGGAVLGLFDGYGKDGGKISNLAADSLGRLAEVQGTAIDLTNLAAELTRRIRAQSAEAGSGTTGVLGVMDGKVLKWVAAGDSLGFVVRKDGRVIELNREDSYRQQLLDKARPSEDDPQFDASQFDAYGSFVTNALGNFYNPDMLQTGVVELQEGDIIVFVSDGVTGDTEQQRMHGGNRAAMSEIVTSRSMSAEQKARALVGAARKTYDDRTALVMEVTRRLDDPTSSERLVTAHAVGATAVLPGS